MSTSKRNVPLWGTLSLALTPFGLLSITLVAVVLEAFRDQSESLKASIPFVTRGAVLFTMACVASGIVAALIALLRRERPRWLPLLGLLSTFCIIGLFILSTGAD